MCQALWQPPGKEKARPCQGQGARGNPGLRIKLVVEVGRSRRDGEERVRAVGGWDPAERLRPWPARGNRAVSVATAASL